MINIIIRDEYNDAVNIKTIIESYMMNFDEEVNYYLISLDEDNIKDKIKSIKGFKIFILNNDSIKENGLDISKYIRCELEDWNSVIILTTRHSEFRNEMVCNRLFLFDLICKSIYFEKHLRQDIDYTLKYYYNRHNCLTFVSNRIIKKIDFRNIYMISKEKDSKKCLIKSSIGNFYTCETLDSVSKRLDKRFIKINRSCIINEDKIEEYNLNENKLTLKSGIISYDVSRDNKKIIASRFNQK